MGEMDDVGRRLDRHHPTALALRRGGHHGMPPWAYYAQACGLPTFSIENHSHTNKVQLSTATPRVVSTFSINGQL